MPTDEAVIDASVAVKLTLHEEHSTVAEALIRSLRRSGVRMIAPLLFSFEVANALHKAAHAGTVTPADAVRHFRELSAYAIETVAPDGLHERAILLASELGVGAAYDSHYLALAIERDCEFWTADWSFYRAARRHSNHARWLADFNPDA